MLLVFYVKLDSKTYLKLTVAKSDGLSASEVDLV